MSAVAPGPGFRLSRGRALRRACLRRRARYQKQGPAATAVKKPLFYQSSMVHIFVTMSWYSYELSNKKYNCVSCDKVTLTVPI